MSALTISLGHRSRRPTTSYNYLANVDIPKRTSATQKRSGRNGGYTGQYAALADYNPAVQRHNRDTGARPAAAAALKPQGAWGKAPKLNSSAPAPQYKRRVPRAAPQPKKAMVHTCAYCKEEGHRIFEWRHGMKCTTCPVLLAKEARREQIAEQRRAEKREKARLRSIEAERRLAQRVEEERALRDQFLKSVQTVLDEGEESSDDSSDEEEEEFPALPSVEQEVAASPESQEESPRVQYLRAQIAKAQKDLDGLGTDSWADACEEEELEEKIAELESQLEAALNA